MKLHSEINSDNFGSVQTRHENEVAQKKLKKPEKCVKKAKNRLKLKEMETILRLKNLNSGLNLR